MLMSHSISILGLGLMGKALAAALLDAGHTVTVWNRSPGKDGELVAKGAVRAGSVSEAVAAGSLVIVCVLDYDAVRELLADAPLDGRAVVNLTNGRPAEAREMAALVTGRGGDYLDGGIMAVPQMIAGPGAMILYSGSETVFDAHRDTLAAMAEPRFLGSDPGLAPLLDLAMLTGMYGQFVGFLEAAALVTSQKVPLKEFTTTLLVPWLNAMAASMPRMAESIESGDYRTDVSNLEVNRIGMANLMSAFEEQGVKADLLVPIKAVIDQRVARGHGAEGLPGLVEELR
jgi:3-hydroxyisobutyrate dehydrogenase-like beta-hydroxyacid dehydrogenase